MARAASGKGELFLFLRMESRDPPSTSSSRRERSPEGEGKEPWQRTTCGEPAAWRRISASREEAAVAEEEGERVLRANREEEVRWRTLWTVPPLPWPRTESFS